MEQLLTTGGGWQDQYGGVLRGVKLLQTHAGMDQSPLVRWLPDYLFTGGEYQKCHLLYYTGITRTAKGILAEIVRSMFLNSTEHLSILGGMKGHALDLYEAIQRGNFDEMGRLVGKSWKLNQALDPGTNPEAVETIIRRLMIIAWDINCQVRGEAAIFIWWLKILRLLYVFEVFLLKPPNIVPVSLIWLCPTKACN